MPPFRQILKDSIRSVLVELLAKETAQRDSAKLRGTPGSASFSETAQKKVESEATSIEVEIERPRVADHGDFSTNIAMVFAKQLAMSPRQLAAVIAESLDLPAEFDEPRVAGPGFLNFSVKPDAWGSVAAEVLEAGTRYGITARPSNERLDIEFVSANPTGPMHLGHARWAAWGDALCRVLEAAGYSVTREFYINDAGNQIDLLGKTIAAHYLRSLGKDATPPPDGYKGSYIQDLVKKLKVEVGDSWAALPEDDLASRCAEWGSSFLLQEIKRQLDGIGVHFDVWTSERALRESALVSETLDELYKRGLAYQDRGAVWFRSTELGDDKDRVLVKSDGQPTYLAVDIAYHVDKFRRGFDGFINIWGADHAGHVPKLNYALQALGFDSSRLEVILGQLVSVSRAGEPVRMSKRSGDLYTFEELVDELGPDAARFHFLMQGPDSALHLDLERAVAQSLENPVYYVQYAHARICSILAKARHLGMREPKAKMALEAPLSAPEEIALLKRLEEFPYLLSDAAAARAPHKLTTWALKISSDFHAFYQSHRVIQAENSQLAHARLALIAACKQALGNCLSILGVTAPERMEKLENPDTAEDKD